MIYELIQIQPQIATVPIKQSQLMQAESECAHWRQAELVSQNEVQKLKLEVGKLKPMVESMRKKVNNNDKVQKFLDKHGSKSMAGGKNRSDGGKVLHDALMVLSATVRTGGGKYSEELSKTVDRVVKLIEEEVKVGRGREKELMLGMMELLDENKYNDEDQGGGGVEEKRRDRDRRSFIAEIEIKIEMFYNVN